MLHILSYILYFLVVAYVLHLILNFIRAHHL